jgi:hypothetical protein
MQAHATRVKCVNRHVQSTSLTIGKEYTVVYADVSYFDIIDDNGRKRTYNKRKAIGNLFDYVC